MLTPSELGALHRISGKSSPPTPPPPSRLLDSLRGLLSSQPPGKARASDDAVEVASRLDEAASVRTGDLHSAKAQIREAPQQPLQGFAQVPDQLDGITDPSAPEGTPGVPVNLPSHDGHAQTFAMLTRADMARNTRVPTPVKVHCGDGDLLTTPFECRRCADAFDAPFSLIRGAGHDSPSDQPAAVADAILAVDPRTLGLTGTRGRSERSATLR